jgi:hypothetical protein
MRKSATSWPLAVHEPETASAVPFLVRTRGARSRSVIATIDPEGLLSVLDRDSDVIFCRVPLTTEPELESLFDIGPTHEEWSGSAYSPRLDLLVAPENETLFAQWLEAGGWVTAFDPTSGRVHWQHASSTPVAGEPTLAPGDLVFTGELDGDVIVLDVGSGRFLFQGRAGGPIVGGVVSHARHSARHVAVVHGHRW